MTRRNDNFAELTKKDGHDDGSLREDGSLFAEEVSVWTPTPLDSECDYLSETLLSDLYDYKQTVPPSFEGSFSKPFWLDTKSSWLLRHDWSRPCPCCGRYCPCVPNGFSKQGYLGTGGGH